MNLLPTRLRRPRRRKISRDSKTVIDGRTYAVVDDRELAVRRLEESVHDMRTAWDAVKVDLDNDALQAAFDRAREAVHLRLERSLDLCTPHGTRDYCWSCAEDQDAATPVGPALIV